MSVESIEGTNGWAKLELRHLSAFRAVARERSFSEAAAALGYTQSAVSAQIASLERITGKRLLDRSGGRRTVALTAAGEAFLEHADAIIARAHAAHADLATVPNEIGTPLRVGTYQSAGARILPPVMSSLASVCPGAEVQLHEALCDEELCRLVESGDLDLTFSVLPPIEGPFASMSLLRDPYVLVVAADSPLATRKAPPTMEEVSQLELVGFRDTSSSRHVEPRLQNGVQDPSTVFRADDNGTVLSLVAQGVGAALMPRLAVDDTDVRITTFDLGDTISPRTLGLVWHRDRRESAVSQAFKDLARECCAAM